MSSDQGVGIPDRHPHIMKTLEYRLETRRRSYVLMTAAYNEEAFIEKTITSVLGQTLLPQKWVIVSDGSTDRTDSIVESYSRRYSFIEFVRVTRKQKGHSYSAKVRALEHADRILRQIPHEYIGNLDADTSINPDYFASLIGELERSPHLGLVSGFIYEETGGEFQSRKSNRTGSIPHAAQLMRRECYEGVGGYAELKYGGEDWYAQTRARMAGWNVAALPTLVVFHHKPTGAGSDAMRNAMRLGKLDYSFGSHPVFEIVKCLLRVPHRPFVVGAAMRLGAFTWCYIRGEQRVVSQDFVNFLRKEQLGRFGSFRQEPEIWRWKVPHSPGS